MSSTPATTATKSTGDTIDVEAEIKMIRYDADAGEDKMTVQYDGTWFSFTAPQHHFHTGHIKATWNAATRKLRIRGATPVGH